MIRFIGIFSVFSYSKMFCVGYDVSCKVKKVIKFLESLIKTCKDMFSALC